jgi:hypothetical protein
VELVGVVHQVRKGLSLPFDLLTAIMRHAAAAVGGCVSSLLGVCEGPRKFAALIVSATMSLCLKLWLLGKSIMNVLAQHCCVT